MAGNEAHNENRNHHAAAAHVVEPANKEERNKLHGAAGEDQGFASGFIDEPKGEESEDQIDQTDQDGLEEGVAAGGAGGAKNFGEEGKNGRDAAELLQTGEHNA